MSDLTWLKFGIVLICAVLYWVNRNHTKSAEQIQLLTEQVSLLQDQQRLHALDIEALEVKEKERARKYQEVISENMRNNIF
jgi:hypothetical protein